MKKPQSSFESTISFSASATVPTRYGDWEMSTFHDAQGVEHVCLTHGDVADHDDVLCRFHSACMTGESSVQSVVTAASSSMERFAASEGRAGVIVYLAQKEDRPTNKLRAYDVLNNGYDTVDAERSACDDIRRYDDANAILKLLGVRSVRLMTNNPDKLRSVREAGLLADREAHLLPVGALAQRYVQTKQHRMGHLNEGSADSQPLFPSEFETLLNAS